MLDRPLTSPAFAIRSERPSGLWPNASAAIVGSWLFVLGTSLQGVKSTLGQHRTLEGHGPFLAGLGLFLIGWQVMVMAMMLPSSLPAFRWFDDLSMGRRQPRLRTSFASGYAIVWLAAGTGGFLADALLHGLVHRLGWLRARPSLIFASALLVGGAFQLTRMSARCRTDPVPVRRRVELPLSLYGAAELGTDHAVTRLRQCWGLMLLAFAVGMGSLAWMAALTALMTVETWRPSAAVPIRLASGAGFVALAPVLVLHPAWLRVVGVS